MKKISVAVVLPRYGANLGGGAEALSKALSEHMKSYGLVSNIEIWTTCAVDHRTWANAFAPGVYDEEGITVHRFLVDERNTDIYVPLEITIQQGISLTIDQQLDWLTHSVNSRGLYEHIVREGQKYDVLLFAPYLFATSFWGALIYPERSVLIPCLHDEPYAYLQVFKHLFTQVRGFLFNANPERELARSIYELEDLDSRSEFVGMGFYESHAVASQSLVNGPYLLYSGRKEQGKNLDLLISYFQSYRQTNADSDLELVLIGSGEINFLKELPEGVTDLGFVSEEEKLSLMKGALALCQPSVNESFSIVLMEAWLQKTPVLVHARCAVTRDHAVTSNGGLYFANEIEFALAVKELETSDSLRIALGQGGFDYVTSVFSWDAVIERLIKAFHKLGILEKDTYEHSTSSALSKNSH